MQKLAFVEKIAYVKAIATEIVIKPAAKFRKLKDLILLCSDAKVDVTIKATTALCDVFCEILPDYRIREFDMSQGDEENKAKDKKNKADEAKEGEGEEGKKEEKKGPP